jgi:hypothetical protein
VRDVVNSVKVYVKFQFLKVTTVVSQPFSSKPTANVCERRQQIACPFFRLREWETLCMQLIKVNEMLAVMDLKDESGAPIPFSFTFDTCDQVHNTGGKRITCKNVIIVGGTTSKSSARNPNHHKHYTRNFRSVNNMEIRKFHPLLVEYFNDMKVIL